MAVERVAGRSAISQQFSRLLLLFFSQLKAGELTRRDTIEVDLKRHVNGLLLATRAHLYPKGSLKAVFSENWDRKNDTARIENR